MNRIFAAFALLAFVLTAIPSAHADDLPEVQAAETYLRGLDSLKARFIQTSGDGKQIAGDFYLKRPGKMRFQYDAPVTDFVVADGLYIYYYDGQMKQQSHTLISRSLADFFLRKDLKLSGDVRVTDVKRDSGLLQITLVESANANGGSLTLGFKENPMQLKKWKVVDAAGAVTEVELFEVKTGITLDSELFKYYDPAHQAGHYN